MCLCLSVCLRLSLCVRVCLCLSVCLSVCYAYNDIKYLCVLSFFAYPCTVAPYDVTISADFMGDITARPAVVEYNDSLTLTCTASGGPDNMFRWLKDGSSLEGNTNSILNILAVTAADGGVYECVVNNTAGNSSANITIYGRSYLPLNTLHIV